jgi:hypothetical protein
MKNIGTYKGYVGKVEIASCTLAYGKIYKKMKILGFIPYDKYICRFGNIFGILHLSDGWQSWRSQFERDVDAIDKSGILS